MDIGLPENLGFHPGRPGQLALALELLDLVALVGVLHIARVAAGHEHVFVAIEIDIQKDRLPRPLARLEARKVGDLGEGAVAPAAEEGVAHHLRTVLDEADGDRRGRHRTHLHLPALVIARHHVHDEKIHLAVAIDIGEIHAHRAAGNAAEREAVDGAEAARAVIDPAAVGRPVVVADIQVGRAVAIHVAELRGEPPVERRARERLAVFIQKGAVCPRDGREFSPAVIRVELIWLAVFLHPALFIDQKAVAQPLRHRQLAIHHEHLQLGEIAVVIAPVVGHVEIEIAVAIRIRERERHRAETRGRAGVGSRIGEAAFAVIGEDGDALPIAPTRAGR